MNNLQIPLTLPLAAVQYIVNQLVERPYKESADLIQMIQVQTSKVVDDAKAAATPTAENPPQAPAQTDPPVV